MAGRKFDLNTGLVFDDGLPVPDALHVYYPESIRAIAGHLSELLSERIQKPGWFNDTVPTILEQIIDFFDAVHAMHESATRVLAEYNQNRRPYCLYLRNFSTAGHRGRELRGETQLFLQPSDQHFREYITDCLDGMLPVVSCFNTLDQFTVASVRQKSKAKPAILRLLSHNWKQSVAALIDNARAIVMHHSMRGHGKMTAGVNTELTFLFQLKQTQRCLLVIDSDHPVPRHGKFDFRATFGWPAARADPEFSAELKTLATDEFRRQSLQPEFPDLPCYVVDRNIEPVLQQFRDSDLPAIRYTNLIPRSLKSNMDLINVNYPKMVSQWTAIEQRLQASQHVGAKEVLHAMFVAMSCFVLATTLEHYEAMARSIAQVGLAHRFVSGDGTLERICLIGAVKFARWEGMDDLAEHFARGLTDEAGPEGERT
ncbi:MAG: hypothetical protein QOJ15_3727 [Bradyrhizobium sp.]|jgi:hypothetical protein|nr:hypothetical protein [Bradyrhizobium sp.]